MKTIPVIFCLLLLFAGVAMAMRPVEEVPPPQPGDSIETLYAKGKEAGEERQDDTAIQCWTMVLKRKPDDAVAFFNRGNVYMDKEEEDEKIAAKSREKALADFSEAIRLNPKYTEAYWRRAVIYAAKEQFDKALADYNAVVSSSPQSTDALIKRGEFFWGRKDTDKAIADFTAAIALDPKLATAYEHRAQTYASLKEWDKVVADYTVIIGFGKQGDNDPPYSSRGDAYAKLGQWDKAIADYNEDIRLETASGDQGDYNNYDIFINRARAYHASGNDAHAIADYTAAAASQGAQDADRDFAHMERGEVYWEKGEKEKALADFTKAIEIHPYTNDYMTLALAQYAAGRYDDAIKTCTTSNEVCEEMVRSYLLRGAAHAARGEAKKAAEDFKEAVDLGREQCQQGKWKSAEGIDELAEAEARTGKFEQAAIHEQMAVDIMHATNTDAKLSKAMEDRLALYQQQKPYLGEKEVKRLTTISDEPVSP